MKKILYNRFIKPKDGRHGYIEEDFKNEGIFLQWGLDSDDNASYTVAIVQDKNGFIENVIPNRIKFIEPYTID